MPDLEPRDSILARAAKHYQGGRGAWFWPADYPPGQTSFHDLRLLPEVSSEIAEVIEGSKAKAGGRIHHHPANPPDQPLPDPW